MFTSNLPHFFIMISLFKKVVTALKGGGAKDKAPKKEKVSAPKSPQHKPRGNKAQQEPRRPHHIPNQPQPHKSGSGNKRPHTGSAPQPKAPAANSAGHPIRHRSQAAAKPASRRGGSGRPAGGSTPASQVRPGGAIASAEVQKRMDAHKAWDVASYVVPAEEGKVRFCDLQLPTEILHAVADLDFKYCTPIQAQSLESALAGKNVTGRAQTGTGKTAAFLIAILTRYLRNPEGRNMSGGSPRALVIAPTRELVIQICKDADALGKYCGDIRSLAVYGGMDYERQRGELHDAPVDLLVATPGRLLDFCRNRIIDLSKVDTLVIDEADRMLDMGFIPDVKAIIRRLPPKEQRCTMMYSATLSDDVLRLAAQWMQEPVRVEVESDTLTTDTIKQIVYIVTAQEKFQVLYNHIKQYEDARMIIFCNRKVTTEHLADNLRRFGIPCETLSGDVNQNKRLQVLEDFREGKIRTVVATDVAGRGIHVDDIAFVVNFDFPYEAEDYVHRIGRTGRAGHTGTAISFADENESFAIPDIEKYINEPLKCSVPEEALFAPLPEPPPRPAHHHQSPRGQSRRNTPRPHVIQQEPPASVPAAESAAEAKPAVEAPAPKPEAPKAEAPARHKAEGHPAPAKPAQKAHHHDAPRQGHNKPRYDRDRHAPERARREEPKPAQYVPPTQPSGGEVWRPGE